MPLMPYLHFQGNCAEALEFYRDIFDGTGLQLMRYADQPEAKPEWKGAMEVMHGQVVLGDGVLMASDFPPGMEGDPQAGVSIMQSAPDIETGRGWFDSLAQEGAVVQDYGPTFFSPGFGMVKDRFGTHWMIAAAG